MKHTPSTTKRFTAWPLAIVITLAGYGPATAIDAITGPNESSPRRTAEIVRLHGSSTAADAATQLKVAQAYRRAPLSFEANVGQTDDGRVKFVSRGDGYNLFLTSTEATFAFFKPQRFVTASNNGNPGSRPGYSPSKVDSIPAGALRISMPGANKAAKLKAVELPGRSNYFIGSDPKKWRANVSTYSRVEYKRIYPGVDIVYYGARQQLEYDFIVAPRANPAAIRLRFEGAERIEIDSAGDLVIENRAGQIRQRKPVMYQEAGGVKEAISGGYVMRGEREAGFEVGRYDPRRALVIDPVLVYSISIGGSGNESAAAVALDAEGNAYITGTTSSLDFPAVNAFQPNLGVGAATGMPSDVFVAKLNSSGTALLYSTYLGGKDVDAANGIAVDSSGNAYVTGFARSSDFPTTAGAFQTKKANEESDAFITKLNPTGNSLVYSTYLGGSSTQSREITTVGRGIAVDQEGAAYVAGYTFSENFPLKKPAQGLFNKGVAFGADCLRNSFAPALEDAFVTKLDPSGGGLVYSTYLGGSSPDEAYGIAVDSTGAAYVIGSTCSFDFFPSSGASIDTGGTMFLVKLGPSGKKFVYASRFGGHGRDLPTGVAVDSEGNAYVTGQTDSDDFPTTLSAFQPRLGGSVLYASTDGGDTWRAISGFSNSSTGAVTIDPRNPLRMYAGFSGRLPAPGLLVSTDGGDRWGNAGIGGPFANGFPASAIAIDPKNSSVVYTDSYKSTNGGMTWTLMRFPLLGPSGPARLLIDPVNSSTVYMVALGGFFSDFVIVPRFWKSTDAGNTWELIRNGLSSFSLSSAVLDPKNPSTLYAASVDLYKSTDGGNTWRIPYAGTRSFQKLAIDPINTSTLYLSDPSGSLFKTTDAGTSFTRLAGFGIAINELLVDPTNSSTVYAAVGSAGRGGGVFKSTDSGQTWSATGLIAASVNTLAIDPFNPSRVFAGVDFDVDGFVVKMNPAGTALTYSTYLGGRSPDSAAGIGVDAVGNAYVTGRTLSDRFPIKDALQAAKPGGLFDTATFATKLDASGSAILFSTYAGDSGPSFGSGIAVDADGRVCIVGTTVPLPAGASTESVRGGVDVLVVKISSPPRIAGASVSARNLIVTGEGFDRGAVILIDGVEQRTRNDEMTPATILIGKKAARNIAPSQTVNIRVRNSDGLVSQPVNFTRLP